MKKVLIVDDDPSSIALLSRFLHPWGCEVHTAFSGGEAVERLHTQAQSQGQDQPGRRAAFDLVISDVRMPYGTGIDLLREIRMLEEPMPVVLMSALGKTAEEQAKALCAFAYLEKPLTREKLNEIVGRLWGTQIPTQTKTSTQAQSEPDGTALLHQNQT